MALSPPGFGVTKLNDSSRIPKQLILKIKRVSEYASMFLRNRVSRNHSLSRSLHVQLRSSKSDSLGNMATATAVFDSKPDRESDGGDDDNGKLPPGNGGGGGGGAGGGGGEDDHDEIEFGPLMKFVEVMKVAKSNGVNLPAAKTTRELILTLYLALQILIDSCCATFAEVLKRGKDFWNEFCWYAAGVLSGIVLDTVLVGMFTPNARIGKKTVASGGLFSGLKNSVAALPSVFEFDRQGCRFSALYFYKAVQYGFIGQGIATIIMNAIRPIHDGWENIKKCCHVIDSWNHSVDASQNKRAVRS